MREAKKNLGTKGLILTLLLFSISACNKLGEQINPVGRITKFYVDESRPNWRGEGPRPMLTTIWYPAVPDTVSEPWEIGVFKAGYSAVDAKPYSNGSPRPLVVLSHGTGGATMQMSWLAESLVKEGYIVAAVNHHGNTAAEEAYLGPGFVLWWERALDLSLLIDKILNDQSLGLAIDPDKVAVAGFSLGGYTALALTGARIDMRQRTEFCRDKPEHASCELPPEANVSIDQIVEAIQQDPQLRASFEQATKSFKDSRIKASFVIAPVHGRALSSKSLREINTPMALVVGSLDKQASADDNASLVASQVASVSITVLPDVSHYTFLANCSLKGRLFVKELCVEAGDVNREQVHQQTSKMAIEFFNQHLSWSRHVQK